jgi:hypothetical protein
MRKLLALCGLVAVFSFLAMAEDYTGHLLDANCYAQSKSAKGCDATGNTTQFILSSSGKVYKLDDAGNAKAADAMKGRADRSADPSHPATGPVNAKATGMADGDTLKIETIQVQ